MKGWIFSRTKARREKNGECEPIQFVSCQFNGSKCVNQRNKINQCLFKSHDSFVDREYDDSMEELKTAYTETLDILGSPCASCAQLFRHRITQSMEQIHGELEQMTTGFFRWDCHKPSYEVASTMINEFRKNA